MRSDASTAQLKTLSALGVTKDQSSQWQKMAEMPELLTANTHTDGFLGSISVALAYLDAPEEVKEELQAAHATGEDVTKKQIKELEDKFAGCSVFRGS